MAMELGQGIFKIPEMDPYFYPAKPTLKSNKKLAL
jgi:hypothetical protein